jgi:hypothetical protein
MSDRNENISELRAALRIAFDIMTDEQWARYQARRREFVLARGSRVAAHVEVGPPVSLTNRIAFWDSRSAPEK